MTKRPLPLWVASVAALVAALTVALQAATYTDAFTEGSTIDLTAHTATPSAGTWAEIADSFDTLDLQAQSSDVVSTETRGNHQTVNIVSWTPAGAEYDVSLTVVQASTSGALTDTFCILARVTPGAVSSDTGTADVDDTYYYACHVSDTTDMRIGKVVAGSATNLASAACGIVATDVITFVVRDASKKVQVDGVDCSGATTSDNAIAAAGNVGLACGSILNGGDDCHSSTDYDDFTLVDVAGGGSPTRRRRNLLGVGLWMVPDVLWRELGR